MKNASDWKPIFLTALRALPNVMKAAKSAGVNRSLAYRVRGEDPEFAAQWDEAIMDAVDNIEGIVIQLAQGRDSKFNLLRLAVLRRYKPEWRETTNQNLKHEGELGINGHVTLYLPRKDKQPKE